MTTAIFWNAPGDVDYRELVLPEPGPGEVLIENVYSLVSPGTEREWLSSAESHFPLGTTFPFVPGYSAAGHIIAVGPGVEGWSTGDAVVATPVTGCHASHLIAPASMVFRVPAGLSLREAVFFNLGMTATHTIRLSDVQLGESLTIVGLGPIGMLATQVAKARGADPILALELDDQRRARAASLGATFAADPRTEEFEAILAELGGGTSVTIDLSGTAAGVNTAIHATQPCGTVVLSTATMAPLTINYGELFIKGLVAKAAFVGARPAETGRDTEIFLRLLAAGQVTTPYDGGQVFSPSDAQAVYKRILAGDKSLTAPIFTWRGEDHG
jgi:2-desacetyl-2-hydroxyethyl bacteriochlorophyllide A dehydrogenase